MKPTNFVLPEPGQVFNSVKVDELLAPCGDLLNKLTESNKDFLPETTLEYCREVVKETKDCANKSRFQKDCLLDELFFVLDGFSPPKHYFGPNKEKTAVGFWPDK